MLLTKWILGPQVFRSNDAPEYIHGYIGLTCVIIVATVAILLYGVLCWHENKLKNKAMLVDGRYHDTEASNTEEAEMSFSDATDKEKLWFKYSY